MQPRISVRHRDTLSDSWIPAGANRTTPRAARGYGELDLASHHVDQPVPEEHRDEQKCGDDQPSGRDDRAVGPSEGQESVRDLWRAIRTANRPPRRWLCHDARQSPSTRWMIDRVRPQPGHFRPRMVRDMQAFGRGNRVKPRTAIRPSGTSTSMNARIATAQAAASICRWCRTDPRGPSSSEHSEITPDLAI